jgi:methionine-rich copper-binding protein CopC
MQATVSNSHSVLTYSKPEPYTIVKSISEVILQYNEEVEVKKFEIFDSKFNKINSNIISNNSNIITIKILDKKLKAGYYTYRYLVISSDGHPVSGAGVFIYGNNNFKKRVYNITYLNNKYKIYADNRGFYKILLPEEVKLIELRNKNLLAPLTVNKIDNNFTFMIPFKGQWELTIISQKDKFNSERFITNINIL